MSIYVYVYVYLEGFVWGMFGCVLEGSSHRLKVMAGERSLVLTA